MKKRPLSSWLGGKNNLNANQVRALLLELATRLEVVELERSEDIDATLGSLCTCSERGADQGHEEVCPQYRRDS